MDQDTIENFVKNLGKRDFDAVARLILTEFFGFKAIDVDGAGDAGGDMLSFADQMSNKVWASTATQKTVQYREWKKKALEDAEKAKSKLHAYRFVFLTSRAHQSSTFREVESEIAAVYGMPAICLGATEISGIIEERGLHAKFFDAIGKNVTFSISERPDRAEIMLHAYVALGSDRASLKDEVFDDSLLLALYESGSLLGRGDLVIAATEILGGLESTKEHIDRRVDSLLAKGVIRRSENGRLGLSEAITSQIGVANGIYASELEGLAAAQSQILRDICNIEWDSRQCQSAATLLARWFMQRQLVTAEHASVPLAKTGIARSLGDPESDLRDLLSAAGVTGGKLKIVVEQFVEVASISPLVKKLNRAVTYVATQGQDVLKASRVLGAANWSEVITTLDASVAIPLLCSKLFAPTSGRFSHGANECISSLSKLGSPIVIPWVYLNEVAAHLLRALHYPEKLDIQDSMCHSQNGFVAHYYQLKANGIPSPNSLRDFIAVFSKAAVSTLQNQSTASVMAELQPLFASYGIAFDDISKVPQKYRDQVEIAYSLKLEDLKRKKPFLLVDHDVQVIAHMRRSRSERNQIRMCLTWDAVMIGVGRELEDCGWIVSPHEASDVVQTRHRIDGAKLNAIAHGLARIRERPSEIGARIIDRVVQLAFDKLQDWQFQQRLEGFYREALGRIDLNSDTYTEVDNEINEFLRSEGIETAVTDLDGGE
jgi:hypothetical protein